MSGHGTYRARAYTLIEIMLVVGLLVALSAMVIPNFVRQIERERLPGSVRQLRSLLTLLRANAAFDGKRYRLRFPTEDERQALEDDSQPLIEREDDPIDDPGAYNRVTAPWAIGTTLLGKVWCAEVRLGRPTIARLQELRKFRSEVEKSMKEALEDEEYELEAERPPLYVEPDGSTDWVTFVLTEAPRDTDLDDLEDHPRIELIMEGMTGLAWMQRPLYDEELDLFEEKGWPAVLRQDFLDPRVLTEKDVLELRDVRIGKVGASGVIEADQPE